MNGKDLWKALNDVEEKYLQEAEDRPKRSFWAGAVYGSQETRFNLSNT